MTLRNELISAIDEVLSKHGVLAEVDKTNDNPATAQLGPDGEWEPSYVKELAAKAELRYPTGEAVEQEFVFSELRWRRKRVVWPKALLASASIYTKDGKPARNDLTERQKASLQEVHNHTLVTTIAGNENRLQFLRVTNAEKGPDIFQIPVYYTHYPERLERDIRQYFKDIGIE